MTLPLAYRRALLAGLSCLSSVLAAYPQYSGEIQLESRYQLTHSPQSGVTLPEPEQTSDCWAVNRARLDITLPASDKWEYSLRLQKSERENDQLPMEEYVANYQQLEYAAFQTPAVPSQELVISRAYACYKGLEAVSVKAGRIGLPEITSQQLGYRPTIGSFIQSQPVGSVLYHTGNKPGVSVSGQARQLGYALAAWKRTDFDNLTVEQRALPFGSKNLRLGVGGRISYSSKVQDADIGVGVGYSHAPLNMGLLIYLGEESSTGFDILNSFACDASVSWKSLQFNTGYQSLTLPVSGYVETEDLPALKIFYQHGTASAFWCETGYLFSGAQHTFDPLTGVISGVRLSGSQPTLELTVRYGHEYRSNILALLTRAGWRDYSTNTQGTEAMSLQTALRYGTEPGVPEYTALITEVVVPSNSLSNNVDIFEQRLWGVSAGLSYHLNEQSSFKAEYEWRQQEFRRAGGPTDWTASFYDHNLGSLRFRGEYRFS